MDLFHSRTQHAVGQGGFHSASIDDGTTVFRYAYDCGSNNANRLAARVGQLREATRSLDALFLSHLDQDHANGTDKLLDLVQVNTVVLPYLTTFERLVLVAESLAAPTSSGSAASLLGMLSRPVEWFSERGVDHVVFVTGPAEAAEAAPVLPPDAPPGEGALTLDVSPTSELSKEMASSVGPGETAKFVSSQPLQVKRAGKALWVLIPFVHPEGFKEDTFRAAVVKILKFRRTPDDDDRKWLDALKTAIKKPSTRKDLADAYTAHIRKDRNLSSMCLYSGPVAPEAAKVGASGDDVYFWRHHGRGRRPYGYEGEFKDTPIGWMGTGDAHLDRMKRRSAFERFYGAYLSRLDTVMLPHHGSSHNLKTGLVQKHAGRNWVAAYGTENTYGHPDEHLMAVADSYGDAVRVTERKTRTFRQIFTLRW